MGNTASSSGSTSTPGTASPQGTKQKDLSQVLNFIATNYILTQSFKDLESLNNPKYCNEMVILTSDVLSKYLTNRDVKYLAQKMKKGVEINEITSENVTFVQANKISDIDVKNPVTKKRLCIGISRYYIKVAHIYAAIMTTINPTYSYKDQYGTTHTVPFSEKNKVPEGTSYTINKVNLCSERVDALVNGQDLSMKDPKQPIKVKPNFCNINLNKKQTEMEEHVSVKILGEETGISQLERLYMDVYDYEKGKFTGMSDAMRAEYKKDLATLYKAFTGKDVVPDSIQTFSQIELRNFHSMAGCKPAPNDQYLKEYQGTAKDKAFVAYANHIKSMMETASKNRNALIGIFDKLFVFATNPQTKKHEITINPKLTDKLLDSLVRETQQLLVKLYTTCEDDFVKGLESFEKIIEAHSKMVLENKIAALKNEMK
jgi:hypothetical protein